MSSGLPPFESSSFVLTAAEVRRRYWREKERENFPLVDFVTLSQPPCVCVSARARRTSSSSGRKVVRDAARDCGPGATLAKQKTKTDESACLRARAARHRCKCVIDEVIICKVALAAPLFVMHATGTQEWFPRCCVRVCHWQVEKCETPSSYLLISFFNEKKNTCVSRAGRCAGHAWLTPPSCGQGSMGEALLLEAVCISSSDMTGAESLEPADKLPPFTPLPLCISL